MADPAYPDAPSQVHAHRQPLRENRSHLVGEDRRHGRQVARAVVLHTEKVVDSQLAFGDGIQVAHPLRLCPDSGGRAKGDEMLSTLRSLVNAILGKVPGKPDRLGTATRLAMDADFTVKPKVEPKRPQRGERDAGRVDPIEELRRLVDSSTDSPECCSRNAGEQRHR